MHKMLCRALKRRDAKDEAFHRHFERRQHFYAVDHGTNMNIINEDFFYVFNESILTVSHLLFQKRSKENSLASWKFVENHAHFALFLILMS